MTLSQTVGGTVLLLVVAISSGAEREALRVCADPNSMPLSNQSGEGYENRIAELLAGELGLPLEYTWFPQRRGFVRNTLRAKDPQTGREKCDLVIGVPTNFELAITTKPYFRSTYALVFQSAGLLSGVQTIADFVALPSERKDELRIGVFEQTPGAVWLAQQGMIKQIVPYITLNADPEAYPGQIIEDGLVNGKIDAAIVWGPIAGYFVSKAGPGKLTLLPLVSGNGIQFDFPISMAVRFGEKEWKSEVEQLLETHADKVNAILRDYNVPLVAEGGHPL